MEIYRLFFVYINKRLTLFTILIRSVVVLAISRTSESTEA